MILKGLLLAWIQRPWSKQQAEGEHESKQECIEHSRSKAKPWKGDIKANIVVTVDLKNQRPQKAFIYLYKVFRPDQSLLNLIWVHLTLGSRWKLECLVHFSLPPPPTHPFGFECNIDNIKEKKCSKMWGLITRRLLLNIWYLKIQYDLPTCTFIHLLWFPLLMSNTS